MRSSEFYYSSVGVDDVDGDNDVDDDGRRVRLTRFRVKNISGMADTWLFDDLIRKARAIPHFYEAARQQLKMSQVESQSSQSMNLEFHPSKKHVFGIEAG